MKKQTFAAKLVKLLNKEFSSPFTDQVKAKLHKDGTASIYIGRRDVQIDEDGNPLGSGTYVGE